MACVALFHLRVGVAREGAALAPNVPLAVVVGTEDERSLQGGTRIDEVCGAAFALGVRPGMTIAAARARTSELCVRVVKPASVGAALARLAESLIAFGATTAFEVAGAGAAYDAVYVDVTGCGHLHATREDPTGERVLAARLATHVAALGLSGRVALASGPRIAHAVARHTPVSPTRAQRSRDARAPSGPLPIVVPVGTEREIMAALPLAALALDEGTERYLTKLGLSVIGDLASLPRDELGSRLGASARTALALANGEDGTPLDPYLPPESPEERVDLDDPVERTDTLAFVAKTLTDRLGLRIEGRGMKTHRLELVFELERSLVPEGMHPHATISVKLAAPISSSNDLFSIVRARLESYEVVAPIKAVVLRALDLAPAHARALDLFEGEPKADRALPELAAELSTLLGKDRVGLLVAEDSWRLERRTTLVPFAEAMQIKGKGGRLTPVDPRIEDRAGLSWAGEEPLRVVANKTPRPFPDVAPLVVRLEATEWWRSRPSAAAPPPRDFVVAWDDEVKAPAWLELDRRTGRAWLRGWKE